jgi:hypothetical protein
LSLLLEENARLRALAVSLSNLLGGLPVREWQHATATTLVTPVCQADSVPPDRAD